MLASWVTFSPSRLLIHHPLGLRQSEESVSWRMEDSRFWSLTREVLRLKYYLSTRRMPRTDEDRVPTGRPLLLPPFIGSSLLDIPTLVCWWVYSFLS